MKYYMVVIDALEVEQEVKLRDILGESGFKFWHRIPGVWIVIGSEDTKTFELDDMITDEIGEDNSRIVVQFIEGQISVTAPSTLHPWFEKHLGLAWDSETSTDIAKANDATQK